MHKATYRDVGNAMNHEYTDAAVEQRESHEDESQDWDLLFVGLACWFSFAVFFSFEIILISSLLFLMVSHAGIPVGT